MSFITTPVDTTMFTFLLLANQADERPRPCHIKEEEEEGDEGAIDARPRPSSAPSSPRHSPPSPLQEQSTTQPIETNQDDYSAQIDYEAFMHRLRDFYKAHRHCPLKTIPTFNKSPISLPKLWRHVEDEGGFDGVTSKKKWASIARAMGGKTSAGAQVKGVYEKILLPYKRHLDGNIGLESEEEDEEEESEEEEESDDEDDGKEQDDDEETSPTQLDDEAFMRRLSDFHSTHLRRSLTIPILNGKPLSLPKLWRLITNGGGFDVVTIQRKWTSIATALGGQTHAGPQVKGVYERILIPYKRHLDGNTDGESEEKEEEEEEQYQEGEKVAKKRKPTKYKPSENEEKDGENQVGTGGKPAVVAVPSSPAPPRKAAFAQSKETARRGTKRLHNDLPPIPRPCAQDATEEIANQLLNFAAGAAEPAISLPSSSHLDPRHLEQQQQQRHVHQQQQTKQQKQQGQQQDEEHQNHIPTSLPPLPLTQSMEAAAQSSLLRAIALARDQCSAQEPFLQRALDLTDLSIRTCQNADQYFQVAGALIEALSLQAVRCEERSRESEKKAERAAKGLAACQQAFQLQLEQQRRKYEDANRTITAGYLSRGGATFLPPDRPHHEHHQSYYVPGYCEQGGHRRPHFAPSITISQSQPPIQQPHNAGTVPPPMHHSPDYLTDRNHQQQPQQPTHAELADMYNLLLSVPDPSKTYNNNEQQP